MRPTINGSVEFNFKTPGASEIMVAQSGESVGAYALKEPKLIYESIESQNMYSQAAAEYADTDFPFVDISYLSGCLTKNHAERFWLKIRFPLYFCHELHLSQKGLN